MSTLEGIEEYYYDELLPQALLCGMTAEEFWYGEPRLIHSYFVKQRMQQSNINYQSWLFGLYTLRAIQVALQTKHTIDYYNMPIEEMNYDSSLYKHTNKVDVAEHSISNFNKWAKALKQKGV